MRHGTFNATLASGLLGWSACTPPDGPAGEDTDPGVETGSGATDPPSETDRDDSEDEHSDSPPDTHTDAPLPETDVPGDTDTDVPPTHSDAGETDTDGTTSADSDTDSDAEPADTDLRDTWVGTDTGVAPPFAPGPWSFHITEALLGDPVCAYIEVRNVGSEAWHLRGLRLSVNVADDVLGTRGVELEIDSEHWVQPGETALLTSAAPCWGVVPDGTWADAGELSPWHGILGGGFLPDDFGFSAGFSGLPWPFDGRRRSVMADGSAHPVYATMGSWDPSDICLSADLVPGSTTHYGSPGVPNPPCTLWTPDDTGGP